MAIPHVFSPIKPGDFTLTPIVVHKQYTIGASDVATTGSGYLLREGLYFGEAMKLGTDKTYPTNSIDGSYKYIIWKSIDAQYYRFPYDSHATLEHANERFTYKFLNVSASILSVPQQVFGEGIKPGSVSITSSILGINLTDDKNGNLYDVGINTSSFTANHNLIAHWGLHNEFRRFKLNTDAAVTLEYKSGVIFYHSNIFSIDTPSILNKVGVSNLIYTSTSSQLLGNGSWLDLNLANNENTSYVLTDDRPEFNFSSMDDFTICFWGYAADGQETTGSYATLLSKNGVVKKSTFGDGYIVKDAGSIQSNNIYSESYFDSSTNVYPYDFSIMLDGSSYGKMQFKRSDGINNTVITSSVVTDLSHHFAVTKSGSLCTMYVDGVSVGSVTDRTLNPINNHCLLFGARNRQQLDFCKGMLMEAKFYNRAFPQSTIQTLAASQSMEMFQTAVVGNVFYKNGVIVVSSHDPKYNNIFGHDFDLNFRNTHTIYQYEALVRIKKGSYNLSQNPSSLQGPNTDLIRNEFTGSDPNTDLFPYITSIGLYNDSNDLIAVGKLAQPLKSRNDVDMTVVVRFDG